MNAALKILRLTPPAFLLFLIGCSPHSHTPIEQVIKEDLDQIYTASDSFSFTLEQAVARALEYNLDAKIAEQDYLVALSDADLQQLNVLPTITAKRDYIARSNEGASSSISAQTGVQSLEPSISTDQRRLVDTLEANWDVLDAAINIYKSKSATDRALIAKERLYKVRQNIYTDVHSAFLRAAMAQKLAPSVEKTITLSEKQLGSLDKAKSSGDMAFDTIADVQGELLDKNRKIKNLYKNLSLAQYELKALLSIEPNQDIELIAPKDWLDANKLPKLKGTIDEYIKQALNQRPELREELLNLRISRRNLNSTIYESFPGLGILITGNSDNNSFLQDQEWLSITATLSQSITRLLTLPKRYQKAEQDIDLADARRQALVAAVISQVYISKTLVDDTYDNYKQQMRMFKISDQKEMRSKAFKENGLLGGYEEAIAELNYEIAKADRFQSFIDAYDAYNRLLSAVGDGLGQYDGGFKVKETKQTKAQDLNLVENNNRRIITDPSNQNTIIKKIQTKTVTTTEITKVKKPLQTLPPVDIRKGGQNG